MNGVAFLLIALGLSVVGSLILWLRYRRPGKVEDAVAEFGNEMRALSPHRPPRTGESGPAGGPAGSGDRSGG